MHSPASPEIPLVGWIALWALLCGWIFLVAWDCWRRD